MSTAPLTLLGLIPKGESQALEFKRSFGRETVETVAAFANTAGGTLLIGVSDQGVVTGVEAAAGALKDWANHISQATGLHPGIETAVVEGKTVVVIRVHESRIKPVLCHGRAFTRAGSTTRQMSIEEITRAALANAGETWDAVPETRARAGDLSGVKVKGFMALINQKGRRPVPPGTSVAAFLKQLRLVRDGRPTRAAILLFGKDPQRFYGQARLKIGRFRGETLIVDDRRIDGTLFDQVEEAMSYLREKLDTRFEVTGRPQRNVVWEYPLKALREAVTNAVCHREYLSVRDTEIRIYDGELLVWNDGGLPRELSIQALLKKHPSVPRNKLIAEIFYYAGMIEQWGGGTGTILAECAAAGLPEPAFEQVQGFRVAFRKAGTPQVPPKYPPSTPQVDLRREILEFCAVPRSIREILDRAGLKDRKSFVALYIQPLVKEGALAMLDAGSPRSPRQRYRTTRNGKSRLEGAGDA